MRRRALFIALGVGLAAGGAALAQGQSNQDAYQLPEPSVSSAQVLRLPRDSSCVHITRATVRFLPIGRRGITPYVGGGIGAFNWHYSEVGEFIFQNDVTDNDRFVADGWAAGPVVLGGIRFPVGDVWTVGGEIRWQKAVGEGLIDQNEFFLGDKIDLGGWNYNFTVHLRF